jgi:hypothetical protein
MPIRVAERSKAWVCSRSPAGIAGSNTVGGMDVCCECCVLSGRGLYDGPIPRPEESYHLWCVIVCDQMNNNRLHLSVKTHIQRGGAERPAACDLIRGNKAVDLFLRIK